MRRRVFLTTAAGAAATAAMGQAIAQTRAKGKTGMTAYEFEFNAIEGGKLSMANFRGKVVLLVNTASFCGFTGQYKDLEALWRKYKDRGLVLLGVPANDFGAQEPGSNAEIKKFCEANFDVSFPLADKQVVIGDKAHPLYKWAAQQTGPLGVPTWNFHKILIGRDGRVIDWFTAMSGVGDKLEQAIEKTPDDPQAKAASLIDILGKLPSVSVGADSGLSSAMLVSK